MKSDGGSALTNKKKNKKKKNRKLNNFTRFAYTFYFTVCVTSFSFALFCAVIVDLSNCQRKTQNEQRAKEAGKEED
jgi:hypothetical protein